jgi:hypothetical protein
VKEVPGTTGRRLKLDATWLRERSPEYRGQWVALRDGVLVDADPRLGVLRSRLPGDRANITLVRVPQNLE